MAWGTGAQTGIADFTRRIRANDASLKSLHVLRFRRLNDQDLEELCGAMRSNTCLTELSLSSHAISEHWAQLLGEAFAANTGLRSVSIGNTTFGDASVGALCAALLGNTSLTFLDLENKGITHAAASSVASCLAAHPRMRHVSLAANPGMGNAGLQQLCACPWRALAHLDLRECGIGSEGVAALAAAPSLGALTCLNLASNPLTPAAGVHLGRILPAASSLATLQLPHTLLGDAGAEALAAALPHARALVSLDLSSVGCGAAACRALAGAVRQSFVPHDLNLGFNPEMDAETVRELAAALREREEQGCSSAGAGSTMGSGIAGLGADKAGAGSSNGNRAAAAPPAAGGLTHLDLSGAGMSSAAVQALAGLPTLQHLSLFSCDLSREGAAAALAAALSGAPQPGAGGAGSSSSGSSSGRSTQAGAMRNGTDSKAAGSSSCGAHFSALQELNVAACHLEESPLRQLLQAACAPGAAPQLSSLVVGGNPGTAAEGFEGEVEDCRRSRPALQVHWLTKDAAAGPGQ